MEEYLAFVDYIGRTIDGQYIYRFDFTVDPDSVWGEFFNVTPAGIVPDMQPDINSLSKTCKVNFPVEMQIAKKNYCFSMQDCIDGIIPVIFSEISEDAVVYNDAPLFFKFGEEYETYCSIDFRWRRPGHERGHPCGGSRGKLQSHRSLRCGTRLCGTD